MKCPECEGSMIEINKGVCAGFSFYRCNSRLEYIPKNKRVKRKCTFSGYIKTLEQKEKK
jgi:hypothetical protein